MAANNDLTSENKSCHSSRAHRRWNITSIASQCRLQHLKAILLALISDMPKSIVAYKLSISDLGKSNDIIMEKFHHWKLTPLFWCLFLYGPLWLILASFHPTGIYHNNIDAYDCTALGLIAITQHYALDSLHRWFKFANVIKPWQLFLRNQLEKVIIHRCFSLLHDHSVMFISLLMKWIICKLSV